MMGPTILATRSRRPSSVNIHDVETFGQVDRTVGGRHGPRAKAELGIESSQAGCSGRLTLPICAGWRCSR
jgi:hypothetical protein